MKHDDFNPDVRFPWRAFGWALVWTVVFVAAFLGTIWVLAGRP